MKVDHVTMLDGGLRALVVLKPSWLARLLGDSMRVVELVKDPDALLEREVWQSAATRRDLQDLEYGVMIRAALEAQPTPDAAALPIARIVKEDG